jgi:NAD+ diphosphatase
VADYAFCPLCGTKLTPKEIEGRERPACPAEECGFVQWDNPLPVVAAVIEHEGQVLLARNKAWPEKMFGLVTGFLEKGEAPEDAVLREVGEEIGIRGDLGGLIGVYPFFQMNQVIVAYHVRTAGEIRLGAELAQFKLVPVERAKAWPFGTGLALRDWLESRLKEA